MHSMLGGLRNSRPDVVVLDLRLGSVLTQSNVAILDFFFFLNISSSEVRDIITSPAVDFIMIKQSSNNDQKTQQLDILLPIHSTYM